MFHLQINTSPPYHIPWQLQGVRSSLSKVSRPPLYEHTISAGFPNPSDDYCERALDLNELLIDRPASTLFILSPDNSLSQYGIFEADLLIIDCSLLPRHGQIVLLRSQRNDSFRKLYNKEGKNFFVAHEREKKPDIIESREEVEIRGVVIAVIYRFKG